MKLAALGLGDAYEAPDPHSISRVVVSLDSPSVRMIDLYCRFGLDRTSSSPNKEYSG